ncbi:MAG: alpha/beta fold hydrolase [Planctomycetota bacterium]
MKQIASNKLWARTRWLALPMAACLGGCSWFRGAAMPIWFENYPAASATARGLVVLLHGIHDGPDDFTRHGFVERIQSANPELDVIAVDGHLGYYIRGLLAERVHQDIVKPYRERYDHIWLVGISLGGLGAMTYAADYPHSVDGVVLLAPFLGSAEVIDEVRAAGGVRSWTAREREHAEDPMQRLAYDAWSWARTLAEHAAESPIVYLGFGETDRFVNAHNLLAEALPADRVLTHDGGHDWSTWTPLFDELAMRALRDAGTQSAQPTAAEAAFRR